MARERGGLPHGGAPSNRRPQTSSPPPPHALNIGDPLSTASMFTQQAQLHTPRGMVQVGVCSHTLLFMSVCLVTHYSSCRAADLLSYSSVRTDLDFNLIFIDQEKFINNLFDILDRYSIVYTKNKDICYRAIIEYKEVLSHKREGCCSFVQSTNRLPARPYPRE